MPGDPASCPTLRAPAEARDAWQHLTEVLARIGTVPCESGDPDAWWPSRTSFQGAWTAIAACHGCAAQEACLSYALAADERFGIWGGLLPEERKALRRQGQRGGDQSSMGRPV